MSPVRVCNRWIGCLLSIIVCATIVKAQISAKHQCPVKTFTCGDGSCIPSDWVGDGENDCDDGSDERPQSQPDNRPEVNFGAINLTPRPFPSVQSATRQTESIHSIPFDASQFPSVSPELNAAQTTAQPFVLEFDPFGSSLVSTPHGQASQTWPTPTWPTSTDSTRGPIVNAEADAQPSADTLHPPQPLPFDPSSFPSESRSSLSTTAATIGIEVGSSCSADNRALVEQCMTLISTWMLKLGDIDPNQPFFTEPSRRNWHLADEGCQLFPRFKQCLGPLYSDAGDCIPTETLTYWESLETYTCQFLLPTGREHGTCFDKLDGSPCQNSHVRVDPTQSTLNGVCNLVFSVKLQLDCIDHVVHLCDASLKDIVAPLRNETEMFNRHYECTKNRPPTIVPIDAQANLAGQLPDQTDECAPLSSLSDCQSLLQSEFSSAHPVNIWALANESTRFERMCATFRQWRTCVAAVPNARCRLVDNGPIHTLAVLSDIFCADDVLKSILLHQPCFLVTESDERVQTCKATFDAQPLQRNMSICTTLAHLNQYMDCVMPPINDLCTIAAQNFVVNVQGRVSDAEISNTCYEDDTTDLPLEFESGFHLQPKIPKCTGEQENAALACLVDLLALQSEFTQFGDKNLLVEISDHNSTVIKRICEIYGRYEHCLANSVFSKENGGDRCSFNAPLNTLTRIGLNPICDGSTRDSLANNRWCIDRLASKPELRRCASELNQITPILTMIIKGAGGLNGDALLCEAYYTIRDVFACMDPLVESECGQEPLGDMQDVRSRITHLGVEEGCPADRPADFDLTLNTAGIKDVSSPIVAGTVQPEQAAVPVEGTNGQTCDAEEQQKFSACVLPVTQMQPHPLAVIKQPRKIKMACEEFEKFLACRQNVRCRPTWANGMAAMFQYACGPALNDYLQVRQCVRKVSTRVDVRKCVQTFSEAAPVDACKTSNMLLECAQPIILDKCGRKASDFVLNYVQQFAVAVDPDCILDAALESGPVTALNCSDEETTSIGECAEPMKAVEQELEDLFDGGLQSFISNMNKLGPIFAKGCEVGETFKACARPLIDDVGTCQVSSCLLVAGNGICNETDKSAAIDKHLNCVFALIAEPNFGKCLRETLATLKEFTLESIKLMLPKFVDCVEPIVLLKCGATPVNVLKAMGGASGHCVVPLDGSVAFIPPSAQPIVPVVCTPQVQKDYESCYNSHMQMHNFMPMALLADPTKIDEVCVNLKQYRDCMAETKSTVCEESSAKAMGSMLEYLCRDLNLKVYKQHAACLAEVTLNEAGQQCMNIYLTATEEDSCQKLNEAAACAAKDTKQRCEETALDVSYAGMNEFARQTNDSCTIRIPSVSLETGCSENDLVQYLECETHLDQFELRPIAIIKNASNFANFCASFNDKYRPCIDSMSCKFEPASSANIGAFDFLCNTRLKKEEYERNGVCLTDYIRTENGQICADSYYDIDFLAEDASTTVCKHFNQMLACAATDLDQQCGIEAVMLSYDIFTSWAHGFDPLCQIIPPDLAPSSAPETTAEAEPSPEVEPESKPEIAPSAAEPESEPESTAEVEPQPETTILDSGLQTVTAEPEPEIVVTRRPVEKTTPSKKRPKEPEASAAAGEVSRSNRLYRMDSCSFLLPLLLCTLLLRRW